MPLQERAKATKVSIVEGAAAVFEEIGYGNTSLSSVAERAGVTKGALYFHFKSKEDLALAVIESQHEVVSREGQRVADLGRGALSTMIMTCGGFGGCWLRNPSSARAFG